MFEFDHHSPAEKELSFEKRQALLTSTASWLRRILDEKRDPDDSSTVALTSATPDEFYYQNKHGSISVYDFIDGTYVEFSHYDSHEERLGITHYLLKQGTGGVWNLQTTGDLFDKPRLHLEFDEWRGLELSDDDERLNQKEPLYPEYLEDADGETVVLFHEIVERGTFGDSRFNFGELNAFMGRTAAILADIDILSKNNPD